MVAVVSEASWTKDQVVEASREMEVERNCSLLLWLVEFEAAVAVGEERTVTTVRLKQDVLESFTRFKRQLLRALSAFGSGGGGRGNVDGPRGSKRVGMGGG
jgi:hypothetical protein